MSKLTGHGDREVLFIRGNPFIPDFYWLEDASKNRISTDSSPKPLADWANSNGYTVRDPDGVIAAHQAKQKYWPKDK